MARNRMKMAFIENETSRKVTFRKRKAGIMKKALELSTLCDVLVAVIIESEYSPVPEVFPSEEGIGRVIAKWETLSEMEKTKKMESQQTFLKQRIEKANERCKKLNKENKELIMKKVMFDCLRENTVPCFLGENEIHDFGGVVDQYINDLNCRIKVLMRNEGSSSTSVVPAAGGFTTSVDMPKPETGSSSTRVNDMIKENIDVMPNVKDFDLNQCSSE